MYVCDQYIVNANDNLTFGGSKTEDETEDKKDINNVCSQFPLYC
jgi:hypothetical protein